MNVSNIGSNNTDYINNLNTEINTDISSDNPLQLAEDLNDSYNYLNTQLNSSSLQSNISQEILLKQEQLLKMENEKLNNQLYNLDQSQSIISNKDTITLQTDKELSKKNNNINFLIFMLIISILTFSVIMLGNQEVIDSTKMNVILGLILLSVFIAIIIFYDILYLGTAFRNMFYNRDDIMINKLNNWKFASNIVDGVDTALYGTQSDWTQANCQYPCDTEEEESTTVSNYNGASVKQTPGYYYNDGSAPSQLINPKGTYNNTNNKKELIYWPDYDQSDKVTNHYKIQPQKKINDIMNKPVPSSYSFDSEDNTSNIDGNLSGNYTITSNL
jgi:hypothetical protein